MQRPAPPAFFGEKQAAAYDQKFAKLAPMKDALHLLIGAVLGSLPEDARILCVGAGTGAELLNLARRFPHWRFTAVEPSAPMLAICRQQVEQNGLASRCELHEGYLESLPLSEPFDAATSLLVSQFILDPQDRIRFFQEVARRLRPEGTLVVADLASDTASPVYDRLLEVWFQLMQLADPPAESMEKIRAAYERDVAVLPPDQVTSMIEAGGFDTPVQFLQTALIHAWSARRAP